MKRERVRKPHDEPVSWLPVDSRLFFPIFSFGHIRGAAKLFLIIEMVLAVSVVIGTFASYILYMFR